jgi:hypothetical protein
MLKDNGERYEHEKFKKLCALASSSSLAPLELSELEEHLHDCPECREVLLQYRTLGTFGMSSLAEGYVEGRGTAGWNEASARRRMLERVAAEQRCAAAPQRDARASTRFSPALGPAVLVAIAACLIAFVAFGAYQLGAEQHRLLGAGVTPIRRSVPDPGVQELATEKAVVDRSLAEQGKKLAQLEAESSQKERELAKLRAALGALEERSSQLAAINAQTVAQSQSLSAEREALTTELQAVTETYQNQKAELSMLHTDREKAALRTASLEAKIEQLTAAKVDQERRLKDTEQYLSSDRDIRELMGARKLYIADVFDVDGASRTQRPFGRVFYTQGKSLIFYAFDLDREPGVVNASAFQVWGQRETPQGEQAPPMNLGILYKDNETNRRWVMRFDEPKQLAEIDAVFVTVEPRGGSHKPTSKPFLFALLRNEANHP